MVSGKPVILLLLMLSQLQHCLHLFARFPTISSSNLIAITICYYYFKGTLFFIVGGYWLLRSLKDPIVSSVLLCCQKLVTLPFG